MLKAPIVKKSLAILLLAVGCFLGCGDSVQEVNVSVKTLNADQSPHRYLQFTLNGQGMITNKDGVKVTPLKLKKGDSINFDIAPLSGGLVLANPQDRSQWTKTFNGESNQTIEYVVVVKKEEAKPPQDAGVTEVADVDAGAVEAAAEVVEKPSTRNSGFTRTMAKRSARSEVSNREVEEPRTWRPKPRPRPLPAPEPEPEPEPVDMLDDLPSDPNEGVVDLMPVDPAPAPSVDPIPLPEPEPDPLPLPDPEPDPSPLPGAEPLPTALGDNGNDELGAMDDGLLGLDEPVGGVGGGADLATIRKTLESGRDLSRTDIASLESVPRKPAREFVEAKRLLGDWYYKNKQWRKQANALKAATEARGPYRKDPTVLLSLAKAYGHMRNYRRAAQVMKNVERYGNRLTKEKRADAYRFHAEMLEFEYLQQKKEDPEKANLELLDQAISKLRKLKTYAGGAPSIVGYADDRIGKLQELKRSDAE